jgi:hypothetical protein
MTKASSDLTQEAARAFVDGVRNRELIQYILVSDKRSLIEVLNQTLKLEAAKPAAGPPARLREVTGTQMGTPVERLSNGSM